MSEIVKIVIPAEARHDLEMTPSSKIMVFSDPSDRGLIIMKAESVAEILAQTSHILNGFQEIMKSEPMDNE